jgi:hypothetical protein
MADVNKSVEISLRANLKQLQDSLAKIPGMTKKEAQAMTRSLASEFNKSQKAAKKAASESKKAARQTTKEYQRSSKKIQDSFKDQANQARRSSKDMKKSFDLAGRSIKNARKGSREFGAAMGSLEDVVSFINPELAAMAGGVGAVGQAARSMSRSLATGNVVLIGIVATLAIAAAAYTLFTHRQAQAKEAFTKFKQGLSEGRKELEKLSSELKALSAELDAGFKINPITQRRQMIRLDQERLLALGQISQKEFDIFGAQEKQSIAHSQLIKREKDLIKAAEERFKKAQQQLVLNKKEREEMYKVRDVLRLNSKERLEVNQMISKSLQKQEDLQKIVSDHPRLLKRINKSYMDALNTTNETLKAETKLINVKDRQKRIAEAAQKAEERRQKVIAITSGLTDQINALEQQNTALALSMASEAEKISGSAKARRDALDNQLELMRAQLTEIEVTAKTEEELLALEEAQAELERASIIISEQKRLITRKEKEDLEAINKKLDAQSNKQKQLSEIAKVRTDLEKIQLQSMLDALPLSQEQFVNETKLGLQKRDTIDKINEATEATLRQAKTKEEIDAAEEDRKKALRAAEITHELELQKIRDESERKRQEQLHAGTSSILQSMSTVTTASLELLEKSGNKNKKLVTALFMAQKVAAIGEIAMNTAKSITAAPAQFGAFAPAAIAGYIATAAAQTAIVMSQQPPKFHMGGMIERTPDESTIIVKRGEAILDRATVNRLGGEQGVNRLQNGQSITPQVIVMNPYKHYDRFMSDRQRMGLSDARNARRGY